MNTFYDNSLLRIGLIFALLGSLLLLAQEQPGPKASPPHEIELYGPGIEFSAFTISKLNAIKAGSPTYRFAITENVRGLKTGLDVELQISIPGKIEFNGRKELTNAVVAVKTKGKVDKLFPAEFNLTFTTKGISANITEDSVGFVAPLFELLFFDFPDAKEYPQAGFRIFKAGDMMPLLSMFGSSSQIGPLQFVKADAGLLEFEAVSTWSGRVPKLPQLIEGDYTQPNFRRPYVGKVVFSKDTFLSHQIEVKNSPAKPDDNREHAEIALKLFKK